MEPNSKQALKIALFFLLFRIIMEVIWLIIFFALDDPSCFPLTNDDPNHSDKRVRDPARMIILLLIGMMII